MIAVVRFRDVGEDVTARVRRALLALSRRPGYEGGWSGPATDDPATWVLVTRWASVGEYRRALSAYEVKLEAHPLLYEAVDEPTAFEEVLGVTPAGEVREAPSDRAADAPDPARREPG